MILSDPDKVLATDRGHANTSIANARRMRPAHVELRGRRRPWAPARPEPLETGPGAETSEAARP